MPFLRKLIAGISRLGGGRRAALGAFGKHPAWDDHAEVALETAGLIEARRTLYTEGIAGNVESGAWAALPAEQRVPFGHWFVRTGAGRLQVGRLWASTDGKGRSRYPMVLCADCDGAAPDVALSRLPPLLAAAEADVQQAATADAVRQAVAAHGAAIRASLATGGGGVAAEPVDLLAGPKWGPDGAKLHGVLYELVRGAGPGLPLDRPAAVGRALAESPVHVRVPARGAGIGGAARAWAGLVRAVAGDMTPVMVLAADGASYADLVVGPAGARHLFCLCAGAAVLPPATEIPYNLDPEFARRAGALIAALGAR